MMKTLRSKFCILLGVIFLIPLSASSETLQIENVDFNFYSSSSSGSLEADRIHFEDEKLKLNLERIKSSLDRGAKWVNVKDNGVSISFDSKELGFVEDWDEISIIDGQVSKTENLAELSFTSVYASKAQETYSLRGFSASCNPVNLLGLSKPLKEIAERCLRLASLRVKSFESNVDYSKIIKSKNPGKVTKRLLGNGMKFKVKDVAFDIVDGILKGEASLKILMYLKLKVEGTVSLDLVSGDTLILKPSKVKLGIFNVRKGFLYALKKANVSDLKVKNDEIYLKL